MTRSSFSFLFLLFPSFFASYRINTNSSIYGCDTPQKKIVNIHFQSFKYFPLLQTKGPNPICCSNARIGSRNVTETFNFVSIYSYFVGTSGLAIVFINITLDSNKKIKKFEFFSIIWKILDHLDDSVVSCCSKCDEN